MRNRTNATHRTYVVLLLAVVAATAALARTATPPPPGPRVYDMKWLNINKWLCPFHNDGRYALDVTRGSGEAGGMWPQPLRNTYLFGAGLWFGSLKTRADGVTVDTLVTFGYNPNSGGSEMSPFDADPDHVAAGASNPADRVYVFPTDWPPDTTYFAQGGNPDLVPRENFSLQDMWCVYSDLGEENHIAPGVPQGIEVYQTVYAWNYPSNQDIFFIIYKVRNARSDTLRNCYMGACIDPDVGNADDDMVGLMLNTYVEALGDTVKNVGYVGDNDNAEVQGGRWLWEGGLPGLMAYKFLESPKGPDGEPLGMTAFKKFTIDIDPPTDPARYLTMAGYDYRTMVKSPFDSLDETPADKRFVQCSGPFTLAPEQVEVLIVAVIGAYFGGPNQTWRDRSRDSLIHLAQKANAAQFIYDQGWLLPGPPAAPRATLVPGDNKVRIVWDNSSEATPDPYYEKVASKPGQGYDPKYKEYDFQGYIVYRSENGSDWGILTQCDLADSLTFEFPPGADSTLADSLWIEADDSGIFYSVVDNRVRNGFTYYYCVTAYDWNYVTTERDTLTGEPTAWDTLILRSGVISNFSTVPRWEPVNYVDPVTCVVKAVGDTVNSALACSSRVVIPFEVMADTYEIHFLGPEYLTLSRSRYGYYVVKRTDGSLTFDTVNFLYDVGTELTRTVPVFNGQEMKMYLEVANPARGFDEFATGNYPADRVKPGVASSQGAWAFRGSDYRIEWVTSPSGYMTAKVFDVTNGGIEVPYGQFYTRTQGNWGPQNANGWSFAFGGRRAFQPTDTLLSGVAYLYICGGYIALNNHDNTNDTLGSMLGSITDGMVWTAIGHKDEGTPPYYNVLYLVSTPGSPKVDSTYKLKVRVVPNPYIVFNEWERTTEDRRVRFTHLPTECTIRIFTLAGDLVRVIEHSADGEQLLEEGGTATWDFLNDNDQLVASGVYVFHVESEVGEYTGKLVFIH